MCVLNYYINADITYLYSIGHVTDHVTLLEEHSKLYHYLAAFETDIQRKMAMELRRADLLKEIPYSLNKNVYEVLIKQTCYQLGEIYMHLYELKFLKLSQKNSDHNVVEGAMKTSDIKKCNEYSSRAIAYLLRFQDMYLKSKPGMSTEMNYTNLNCREIAAVKCMNPDLSKLL